MLVTKRILPLILTAAGCLPLGAAPQSAPEWRQLFNGHDLTGWQHVGPGALTVEDGLIRTHGGMGLLWWTGGKISNSVIRVVYKMRDHNDNSGVFVRIPIEPREEWMPVHGQTRPGVEWNTIEITLDGPRTVVYLNGIKVTDYAEGQPVGPRTFSFEPQRAPRPLEGYIGLQNHSDDDIVFFKEVAVRPLK